MSSMTTVSSKYREGKDQNELRMSAAMLQCCNVACSPSCIKLCQYSIQFTFYNVGLTVTENMKICNKLQNEIQ